MDNQKKVIRAMEQQEGKSTMKTLKEDRRMDNQKQTRRPSIGCRRAGGPEILEVLAFALSGQPRPMVVMPLT